MSSLTKKFMAYRAQPKKPAAPAAPRWEDPPDYKVEGFVSKDETILERMGRLTEAIARGERLSDENRHFFRLHKRIQRGPLRFKVTVLERRSQLAIHLSHRRMMAQTQGVIGGMR